MPATSRAVRLLLVPLVAALPLALSVAPASAHDSIVGTVPASGATVTTAPTSVVIQLEEPPAEIGSSVAVTAPGGASVTSGAAVASGTTLSVPLAPLTADGAYTVAYRVVSDDGHVITGTYTWTLSTGRSASPTASTAAAGTTSPSSSGSSIAWWIPAALLAVVIAVAAAIVVRRRRPGPDDV